MFKFKSLKSSVASFIEDRSGNFAVIFALTSIPLLMSVGLAVDYTRMLTAKSDMQNALDAAVLSTAKDIAQGKINSSQAKSAVTNFFEANINANKLDIAAVKLVNFKFDPKTIKISATAETDLPLMFPVFTYGPNARVSTSSVASYVERKVEVSMVLDVTGSMNQDANGNPDPTKINELKVAAKAGVKEFIDNNISGNTRVAIVPYAFGVNAGALKSYVTNEVGLPAKDSCATDRRGSYMFTDAGPTTSKLTRANTINNWELNTKSGTIEVRTDGFDLDLPMDGKRYGKRYGADCPAAAVQPLTNDSKLLNSTIDKLEAKGGTAGQIGLQWGWYMISENWQSIFAPSAKPADYNTPNVEKVIILMTDGMFNSEASGLSNAAIPSASGIANPSGRLAMKYCNEIKDKSVKIYTIGFRLKDIKNAIEQKEAGRVLADCASTPAAGETTFFDAENGAELTAAFKEIAKRVEVVSLTN
jgi:Flp pilus assembly protein TadG